MSYASDQEAFIIARQYNFLDADDSFYEHLTLDGDLRMLRLASIPARSNILIKYNKNELDPPE